MMNLKIWVVVFWLLSGVAFAGEREVFRCDFDGVVTGGTSEGRVVDGYEGSRSLLIDLDGPGTRTRRFSIPAERLNDRFAKLEAVVKAEAVSERPQPWNGIKVMLVLETADGARQYPQIQIPVGTFDWRKTARTIRLPREIRSASLVVGLEAVRGRVWLDDLVVTVGRPDRTGRRYETKFKGHDLPRLRGMMYGPRFRESDLRDLALKWNANQIRWQLNWTPMKEAEEWARDLEAYDRWLDGALAECDKALDACEKYGIKVLVDLHTPPGGRADGGVCRMFQKQQYQDKLVEVWDRIAKRYKGREVVYAYDLLNEAVEGTVAEGLLDWRDLATKAAQRIRQIDPGKPVVFEPSPWGGPDGFDFLTPLDLDRVIYSFHMYRPHSFTHQGVHNDRTGIEYPGRVDGEYWDKQRLREEMLPAIEFQKAFNVQMYVGEFSAIRWAPGDSGYRYLRDVIDLFEEYEWDWSYHAFREWDGWSVEHGPDRADRTPTAAPTKRMELLLEWFARNQRPGAAETAGSGDKSFVTILKAGPEAPVARPGAGFRITYRWQARPMEADYAVFVHVLDENGEIVLQDDHQPPTPTSTWDGLVEYQRTVPLEKWRVENDKTVDASLPEGRYDICAGLYEKRTGRKVALNAGPEVVERGRGRYRVGVLTVDGDAPIPAPGEKTLDLSGYELTFDEEFNDLSVSAWGPAGPGGTRWIAHTPWHGDFGDARFTDPQPGFPFVVQDGILRIEARKEDGKWRSGLLSAVDPKGNGFRQQYGYFECRAKFPRGPGTWPAFWLMGLKSLKALPENKGSRVNPEVDVVEHYGHWPWRLHYVLHQWGLDGAESSHEGKQLTVFGMEEDFHTYGVMIDEKEIILYFDGVELHREATPESVKTPLFPLVNLALGPGWPTDRTPNPSFMYVDYVKIWKRRTRE